MNAVAVLDKPTVIGFETSVKNGMIEIPVQYRNVFVKPIFVEIRIKEENTEPKPVFGCAKGQFKMADDFDAPLDIFKDYM